MYSLRRERDGAGDSGGMSEAIWWSEEEGIQTEQNARPRVGIRLRVGSLYARTFQVQDWWCTTDITRILEESEHYVKFETINSIYEWWHK